MNSKLKTSERFHSLDALRAVMMGLGIILHVIVSYCVEPHGASWPLSFGDHPKSASWPYQSPGGLMLLDWLYDFLHVFRMPLFFVLSGFFTHLLFEKRGLGNLLRNRAKRIVLPLLVFWPFVFSFTALGMMKLMGTLKEGRIQENEFVNSGNVLSVLSPLHLWFLYFLVYFYAGVGLWIGATRAFPGLGAFSYDAFARLFRSRWAVVAFAVPHSLLLYFSGGKILSAVNFIPRFDALAFYFGFFVFGWCLYLFRSELGRMKDSAIPHLAVGIAGFLVIKQIGTLGDPRAVLFASGAAAVCAWSFVFAGMGLFLRLFHRPSKVFSYMAESSYWMYLIHLPLVIFFVGVLMDLQIPVTAKISIVLLMTLLTLVLTYHWGVRNRWIGRFLGGGDHRVPTSDLPGQDLFS